MLLIGCDFPPLEGTKWSSLQFQEEQLNLKHLIQFLSQHLRVTAHKEPPLA